ncbi:hypothetical protein Pelo_1832 [Pelomyxa schiedti]|nr:hypothetical protein Pelo_1832 [Pelomyxa schiedti]
MDARIVVKNGWLVKEGGLRRTHKRRWFVLTTMSLYYSKNEKSAHPQGMISFRGGVTCMQYFPGCSASTTEMRGYVFMVKTNSRDYFLMADTPALMQEWISSINFAIQKTQERQITCHNFTKISISSATCAWCHESVPSLGRQAYRCDDCGFIIHTKCFNAVEGNAKMLCARALW